MDKVLVKIYVPILEEVYDVKIPTNKRISNVIELINKAIYELSGGSFEKDSPHVLYDKITGEKYDFNLNIKQANINNGKEIILI